MIFKDGSYIESFTNMMNEGFIVVDSKGIIKVYNKKAREIFAIDNKASYSHPEGKIKEGDLVFIANNSISRDDGKLLPEDLELLGIKDPNIEIGDAIVAMGVYKSSKTRPIYKYLKADKNAESLELKEDLLSIASEIKIDFKEKELLINLNNKAYCLNYDKSIGHMVILDGRTRKLKFFQDYGYTARNEGLKTILYGGSYRAKGDREEKLEPLGKKIKDINKSDYIINRLILVARGLAGAEENKFEEINGISSLCSVYPVEKNGQVVGAALKVEDITDLRRAKNDRDRAINQLKIIERQIEDKEKIYKGFSEFIGDSSDVYNIKKLALRASEILSNVLILGESGTGKGVLARLIHENSPRSKGRFVHVNCGAIPSNLLESELFGYSRGAFTGADSRGKEGYFKQAHGGTIFLDEIGDLPFELQVKLLKVIQDKKFYPLGSSKEEEVDIRIIAATNKNLEKEVMENRFREDLYYRINVFPIWISPLRERKEDIYGIIEFMLPRICKKLGIAEKKISAEGLNLMIRYDWPGNVRELENILERGVNLSEGSLILTRDIKLGDRIDLGGKKVALTMKEALEIEEKRIIEETLFLHKGNKQKTMETLNMSRSNFYKKLKDYGIN